MIERMSAEPLNYRITIELDDDEVYI